MNQGPLDRTRFEAIEAYVLGQMPPDERVRFEQELAADAVLRSEVELQRENTLAIELGGIERTIRTVAQEHGMEDAKIRGRWPTYLKYAAVVAVVLTATVWYALRPSRNERLFTAHFIADPGLPVAMSASNDHPFQDAMVAYKLGDFNEARAKWSQLLVADPTNDTLRYYIACASLGMDDLQAAVPLLEGLVHDRGTRFRSEAKWYLFLAYIKQGELAKAKGMPLDDDARYGDRARAIKAELK